ncbi:MAG: hypothetical protein ABSC64_02245 [Candidatus Korobacteraceae bacterium]
MKRSIQVLVPPKDYPVTLDEAAAFLHVDPSNVSQSKMIESIIAAATGMVEKYIGRALLTQTLVMEYMPNPPEILPMRLHPFRAAPLQSVASIYSFDQQGNEYLQSTEKYFVDTKTIPGRVQLLMGFWWDYYVYGFYQITYTAGFGDDRSDVPPEIKQAILAQISQIYQSREEFDYTIAPQAEVLLQDWKLDEWDYRDSSSVKWSPFGTAELGYGYR